MNRKLAISFSLFILFCVSAFTAAAQGVYLDPSPTDVTGQVRLYVDITSTECNCPELQDVDPESNPLYIWAWNPNEDRGQVNGMDATNGDWDNSNENMKMQQDESNPNLWYFDFFGVSMTEFYQQPAAIFYESGIDFLVKEKNGAPEGMPEQKSPDLHIDPEPVGCFEKICPFPTTFFQDDYFVIVYDNKKENNASMQNLDPDNCLLWYRISVNGGPLQVVQEPTDKFKMEYDGDGVFSKTMIPEEYFELGDGDVLTQIDVYITKSPINVPPFTAPISLFPGCP